MAAARPHHSIIPRWLVHFGALGLFAVAVVDSSVVPLPLPGSTDLLLLWLVSHRGEPWLLAGSALAGSLLGGYLTWGVGKKSGEAALAKYETHGWFKRVSGWVKEHSIAAIVIPALLPPPIPLTPFVLGAGALGVSRARFLTAFGLARLVRYSLVTWLALRYGRHMVGLWNRKIQEWPTTIGWLLAAIGLIGVCIWGWKAMKNSELLASGTH